MTISGLLLFHLTLIIAPSSVTAEGTTGAPSVAASQRQAPILAPRNPYLPGALQELPGADEWLHWLGAGEDKGWSLGGELGILAEIALPPASDDIAKYAPEFFHSTERRLVVGEQRGESVPRFLVGILAVPMQPNVPGQQADRYPFLTLYSGESLAAAMEIADNFEHLYTQRSTKSSAALVPKWGWECQEQCAQMNNWCLINAAFDFAICMSGAETLLQEAFCAMQLEMAGFMCFMQWSFCNMSCDPI